jgi:putative ABC transport system permease protein
MNQVFISGQLNCAPCLRLTRKCLSEKRFPGGARRPTLTLMFRSALAAALRSMARSRFHTAIGVAGLSVAFAAILVITLFVRNELGYDAHVPGHERIYRIAFVGQPQNGAPMRFDLGNADIAAKLLAAVPEVEAVTRLKPTSLGIGTGDVEFTEELFWADPDFFSVLPMQSLSGDLRTALDEPGSAVVTRRIARKYFGSEDAIGKTLSIRRQRNLVVTAVLADPPSNTHLSAEIFASGRAPYSALSIFDARPPAPPQMGAEVFTYLRVRPGVSGASLDAALKRFGESYPLDMTWGSYSLKAVPLTRIHFEPAGLGAMKPPGSLTAIRAMSAVGVLILVMAVINFVNLTTARSVRRAVEVGVRKVSGANRGQLAIQFIGEALLYAVCSLVLALALVETCLPHLNALLGWDISFRYADQLGFVLLMLAAAAATGVLAGIYPAWILAGFNPRAALYAAARSAESGVVRHVLVTAQFAILTGLLLATFVIYRQTDFALNHRLRVPTNQLVMLRTSCGDMLRRKVLEIPGVGAAACSALSLQQISITSAGFRKPDGGSLTLRMTAVDEGLFELFGMTPLAGRFFSRTRTADRLPAGYDGNGNNFEYDGPEPPLAAAVINATAARQLGATTADAALGRMLRMEGDGNFVVFQVVGVVPDFPADSIREPVQPTIYYFAPAHFGLMLAKFSGQDIPGMLVAMEKLWKEMGDPRPMDLVFYDRYVAELHRDVTRQAGASAAFSLVAAAIACLGLLGLSALIAERRTREIGLRKALGASTSDVMRLLLWQFSKPVLCGTLIAWPVAGYLMQRWLSGFAYRIDLPLWLFPATTLATVSIALATVSTHALWVARAKPVSALRYE